jgi:hypothetical protein
MSREGAYITRTSREGRGPGAGTGYHLRAANAADKEGAVVEERGAVAEEKDEKRARQAAQSRQAAQAALEEREVQAAVHTREIQAAMHAAETALERRKSQQQVDLIDRLKREVGMGGRGVVYDSHGGGYVRGGGARDGGAVQEYLGSGGRNGEARSSGRRSSNRRSSNRRSNNRIVEQQYNEDTEQYYNEDTEQYYIDRSWGTHGNSEQRGYDGHNAEFLGASKAAGQHDFFDSHVRQPWRNNNRHSEHSECTDDDLSSTNAAEPQLNEHFSIHGSNNLGGEAPSTAPPPTSLHSLAEQIQGSMGAVDSTVETTIDRAAERTVEKSAASVHARKLGADAAAHAAAHALNWLPFHHRLPLVVMRTRYGVAHPPSRIPNG